jgi:hypothetical protein
VFSGSLYFKRNWSQITGIGLKLLILDIKLR